LATTISHDYASREPLVLIGVLKGAFIFLADLARRLTVPHRIEFVALSRYGDRGIVGGELRIDMDLREGIEDAHVIIVEDIVDSGQTLAWLIGALARRNPASLKTIALVQKPDRTEVDVRIDYLGFEIPDKWVVGYGLDYKDRHRTLPYIGTITPD